MVFEVLDNSIDEHLAGFCDKIEVTVHVDGSVSVRDNGRGIPVDIHPKWKMPAVELVLNQFARGRKIRPGRVQIFWRLARRRRQMHQRAL
jgi:DNA gyrase subunit B